MASYFTGAIPAVASGDLHHRHHGPTEGQHHQAISPPRGGGDSDYLETASTRSTSEVTVSDMIAPSVSDQYSRFGIERGFWKINQGAKELLRFSNIYQQSRAELSPRTNDPSDFSCLPREIDLVSMTQLSWGILNAVSDINTHERRMADRAASMACLRDRPHGIASTREKRSKRKRVKVFNNNNALRCKTCGTLESPRWRDGPEGPLTLCNVCGLLFAKKTQREGETEYVQ
ncbi:hypothetical protein B0T17DRAFT_151428 [Bombardia bombarda]|uniref:GATA-type domain-containing protein n=1 Tax=Bombardia bombarda TaxID=252184 RepID=A0AA39X6T4_9PEZI|nr:hypothetical protein B0T17DRAFT_151428 [Bombardia bombarda]